MTKKGISISVSFSTLMCVVLFGAIFYFIVSIFLAPRLETKTEQEDSNCYINPKWQVPCTEDINGITVDCYVYNQCQNDNLLNNGLHTKICYAFYDMNTKEFKKCFDRLEKLDINCLDYAKLEGPRIICDNRERSKKNILSGGVVN